MSKEQSRTRKVLATLVVLGLLAALATIATFAAFSSTTSNSSNDFEAGTVYISDNDGTQMMYDLTNQKPLASVEKCIKVSYTGTLDAAVKLYGTAPGTFGDYVDLKIEEGADNSDVFPTCTNFVATGTLYTGELDDFAATHSNFTNGLATTDSNGNAWATTDSRVYRFTVTLQDNNAANGQGTGPLGTDDHSFSWEAQNLP
ncbi:MAG: TasA family protein [Actinomycetota bacterium]